MAGFFGLFDYNKPGPGVDKGPSNKKGFIIFLEIYSRKFWKLAEANILFVLFSLPILTMGLANAGLAKVARNFSREKHSFVASDFMQTIRDNWKQALPAGIINLAILAIDLWAVWFYLRMENGGVFAVIGLAVSVGFYVIFTFAKYYLYFMMVTFRLTLKQLYKNSFIFAFAGMKRNLIISIVLILLYALGVFLYLFNPIVGSVAIILVYVFVFPAFRSLLVQYNVFPMIKEHMIDRYYQDHPGEDTEAKRALNIEDEYTKQEDEKTETVFQDMGAQKAVEEQAESPKRTLPRQYSEQEMSRYRSHISRRGSDADEDGTI